MHLPQQGLSAATWRTGSAGSGIHFDVCGTLAGVRVVIWNLSHWQKTDEQRARAWAALRELGADVALLQECVPPQDAEQVVYREIGGRRRWGSAVVGLTVPIEPIARARGRANSRAVELHRTLPGSVAVARARAGNRSLTLVSMYGVIEDGYADTTIHRQLSDLVPLLDSPEHEAEIVLGGDLNITTQWAGKDRRYRDWETATFARIKAFGLVDALDIKRAQGPLEGCGCADGDACRHIQTQRHERSKRPWQNDYLFVSRAMTSAGLVERAEVIEDSSLHELSGHMPLLLQLAVGA